MDNAPIHSYGLNPIITGRGYIPVYLPPYSPELNSIDQFWKVLKDRVITSQLKDVETLTSGIIERFLSHPRNKTNNSLQKIFY